VFVFVVYAVGVWYFAAVYRRRWPGFLAVLIGFLGLALVNYFHGRLNDWTNGAIILPVLRHLMYPYTALVVGAGLYAACLPRREPEGACPACGYSLLGLPHDEVELCPECGASIGGHRRGAAPGASHEPRTLATWRAHARERRGGGRAPAGPPPASSGSRAGARARSG